MWKGRFTQETAGPMRRIGESVSLDGRLYRHDIAGSIAHAGALARAGLLAPAELEAIRDGLLAIRDDIAAGRFEFDPALEDVHMNIEAELTRRIGPAGAKLHTARSRNDQVALDLRLYLRDECDAIRDAIRSLQRALVRLASRHPEAAMPGYTHLQRAQPTLFAHHLLAYVEMLERDAGRFADARSRMNVLPLGSGALAGSSIALDREAVARELGFDSVSQNSMDAVSDRDFAAEFLAACAILGMHLSRAGEDVVLWTSSEFGFLRLADAFTTGSSLMPQKRNPDAAELVRGKSGRLFGNLVALLTVVKGLPLSYNRDLQEDKQPVFDSGDTVRLALEVFAAMLDSAEFDEARAAAALGDDLLLATEVADYLVRRGMPFRHAHETVGRLVARCESLGCAFSALPLAEFRAASDLFDESVRRCFDRRAALESRAAAGAPSFANVRARLNHWRNALEIPDM